MNRYIIRFVLLSAAIGVFLFRDPITTKSLLLFAIVLVLIGFSSYWLYHLDRGRDQEQKTNNDE